MSIHRTNPAVTMSAQHAVVCICCGHLYSQAYDVFARCQNCAEACYSRLPIGAARALSTTITNERLRTA